MSFSGSMENSSVPKPTAIPLFLSRWIGGKQRLASMLVGLKLIEMPVRAASSISSSSTNTMCAACTRGDRKPIASR